MKKWVLASLLVAFSASTAMAVPFTWDLSGTDYQALGPQVTDGGDTVNFNGSIGTASTVGTTSLIIQSLTGGADDSILDNGDTFSEFGALTILDADNTNLSFIARGSDPLNSSSYRNAYVEFSNLTGFITNYSDNGTATSLANYGTSLADDTFDLVFTPNVGSIQIFLDDDFDSSNGALELASLTLLNGQGTSPEFILNQAEGNFGLNAGFLDVAPGVWSFTDGTLFEEWMAQYGIPSIFATSFNLGATVVGISDDGTNLLFDVVNEGSFVISAVPEPSTMFLLGSGLLGLGFFARRRSKK